MSRDIKFRAWSVDGKRFTGRFCIGDDGCFVDMTSSDANEWTTLDGMIVDRYTGLKDKNDREIYGGDLLRSDKDITLRDIKHGEYAGDLYVEHETLQKSDITYQVEWSGTDFHLLARDQSGSCVRVFGLGDYALSTDETQVIGNIYEHP